MNDVIQSNLRTLPPVNSVLDHPHVRPLIDAHGREAVLGWVRDELADVRRQLAAGVVNGDRNAVAERVAESLANKAQAAGLQRIGPVINATGVILHTGLGRAALSTEARETLVELSGAGNVEIDLETGDRRYRGYQLTPAWQTLTGCEDALIVNNNAAATLLTLQALCAGKEVVISRGQLIEIGGSFRLPEIFELSGAKLREVGTTNRTKLADYERAIGPDTAAIMHVHPSNYRVIGFTETPGIAALVELARQHNLVCIDDIGSGSLVDVAKFGLPPEPTFPESIAAGADVVLGSGDKLLGGPQAGILLGRREVVDRVRRHPLARAVRVDKLALAALSATLDAYLRGTPEQDIPTLQMLSATVKELRTRAKAMRKKLSSSKSLTVEVREDTAPVGGGSLPGAELPTIVVSVSHGEFSADELAHQLRTGPIRVLGRIHQGELLLDLRSVLAEDDAKIVQVLRNLYIPPAP